jgi:hypothetical protein
MANPCGTTADNDGAYALRQAAALLTQVPGTSRYGPFSHQLALYITKMLQVTQPPAAAALPPQGGPVPPG